jgi:hypothetical protein
VEAVDDAAVEDRALEMPAGVAVDPEPAQVAVRNVRNAVINGAAGCDVATQYERRAQMWSVRRRPAPY